MISETGQNIAGYVLHPEFAGGGMATIHLAQRTGAAGFARVCAVKRMRPELTRDPPFVQMFLDEARLAARIQHPNVVQTLDVVSEAGELLIVMEYVRSLSLSSLRKLAHSTGQPIPVGVVLAVMGNALEGLHAAHEAKAEDGAPLEIIHRDVSPHNILVGVDGIAKLVDFGVAKFTGQQHSTVTGQIKGKIRYMAPEQLGGKPIDRRVDIFATGVVLWELLAGRRRFGGETMDEVFGQILLTDTEPLHQERSDVPEALDAVLKKATARDRDDRFSTAADFLEELEGAATFSPKRHVREWVVSLGREQIEERDAVVQRLESAFRERTTRQAVSAEPSPASAKTVQVGRRVEPAESIESESHKSSALAATPANVMETTGGTATPGLRAKPAEAGGPWQTVLIAACAAMAAATIALVVNRSPEPATQTPTAAALALQASGTVSVTALESSSVAVEPSLQPPALTSASSSSYAKRVGRAITPTKTASASASVTTTATTPASAPTSTVRLPPPTL